MDFSKMFNVGIDKVVDSVGKGLDNLFTSDDERNQAKIILAKNMQDFKKEMEDSSLEFEKEITARWKSDNESIITRLVRPVSYISVLVLFGGVVLSDGNIGDFKINASYIPLLETLLVTMTIAYFGSRGAEKMTKSWKK